MVVEGLVGQEEVALGEVGGQVGEDVREPDAVEELLVGLPGVQPEGHGYAGPVEEGADLAEPGQQVVPAPGAPRGPVGEVPAVCVVLDLGHGGVQFGQVQAPAGRGVHEGVSDGVRAGAGGQFAVQGGDPLLDAGGPFGGGGGAVVAQVVEGVGGRPQGVQRRAQRGGHQLDQGVLRGVLSSGPEPAQSVGRP